MATNEEACADLDNRIAAISEDLADLKAHRAEEIAGSDDDAARRRVLVALQANRCEAIDSDLVSASVSGPDASEPRRFRNIIADLPMALCPSRRSRTCPPPTCIS